MTDHVGENFGISLGLELVPVSKEVVPKRGVVLDNAVVDNCQISRLIDMGMGVGVTRQSVSCPTSMTDADRAVNGALVQQVCETGHAPDALANLQAAVIEQAKPGV